jgi:hypothetical protein
MRALLFTVLVSFNLVACVTGDNADDTNMDMPVGEITAAQQDDMVDQDVSDEDAQIRSDRERAVPANEIDQSASAKEQTATPAGTQPAIEAVLEKRPVRDSELPGVNGPSLQQDAHVPTTDGQLEQDGQLPRIIEDTELETLTDEELLQLEQEGHILPAKYQVEIHGNQIDANLPALR